MSELIIKAKLFAYEKHKGQKRKGSDIPFTSHLDRVASIVETLTDDEEVIAASWLHDVVEDTDATLEEVRELFGERVAHFVNLESENKRPEVDSKKTWKIRKVEQIEELRNTKEEDSDVFIIALADKLANTTDLLESKRKRGARIWRHFNNSNPFAQEWYYQSFANIIKEKSDLGDSDVYKEYIKVLNELFIENCNK